MGTTTRVYILALYLKGNDHDSGDYKILGGGGVSIRFWGRDLTAKLSIETFYTTTYIFNTHLYKIHALKWILRLFVDIWE